MALSDAGIDLGAAGSAITFGGDGALNLDTDGLEIGGLSMDADGLELEDLSISEGGVSIGEAGSDAYTKLGEGTIEAGKFHLTMTSDNTAYMEGVGNIFIDNGEEGLGVELNEEGMEIFSEVGDEPDLKLTGQSLTFNGTAGAS
jgi:hypothetical protein